MRLNEELIKKSKADEQHNWRVLRNEKLAQLKERLRLTEKQLSQGKAELVKKFNDLKVQYELLESSFATLEKNREEQLGKFYPNLICTQSLGHVVDVIKEDMWVNPLKYFNNEGDSDEEDEEDDEEENVHTSGQSFSDTLQKLNKFTGRCGGHHGMQLPMTVADMGTIALLNGKAHIE